MKVFSKNKDLGNKANNLIILFRNNFLIPNTFIVGLDLFNEINIDFLDQNKKYILRPSFLLEDSEQLSSAGYFRSLYPLSNTQIIQYFKDKNFDEIFNGNGNVLQSIIIQDFIECELYGVYFSRNPKNIFLKGFYELSNENDGVTAGKTNQKTHLPFMFSKELELTGMKLEKIFGNPLDLEFLIVNNKLFFLQSRPITSGNDTIYNFVTIKQFYGSYQYLDFDEIGNNPDYFCFEVLERLFDIIYLGGKIYFKTHLFPYFIFKQIVTEDNNLNCFYINYKKYLFNKFLFKIIKLFCFQQLDNLVLSLFFKDYNYSFVKYKKSNLDLIFTYNTNFITRMYLKLEFKKQIAFKNLEMYKNTYQRGLEFKRDNGTYKNKLLIVKGLIINQKDDDDYIYKGKIIGIITDEYNFDYNKTNQVLISENLNLFIYNKLHLLSGVIIKNGNKLSHNSIILRENKIPSLINYRYYNDLVIGNNINL